MKNIARILVLFTILLVSGAASAQPWMEQFRDWDREPTTQEIITAFDTYWDGREPTRGSGYKQFMRWRHFVENRLDESGQFNPTGQWTGWEEKRAMFPASDLDEAAWSPLGPFDPIAGSYVGGLGRVNCLAQDPTNPQILYAGAASGGLWKSFTGGYAWVPLTDDLPVLGVSHIEVNPDDPAILYMATGDADGQDTYSVGVMKSYDGGLNWELTGLSFDVTEGRRMSKVLISDANSDILIAGTSQGIYRSTDAGDTWTLVEAANGFPHDLEKHATDPNTFYAAMSGNGVYRSTDGGLTWGRLDSGLPGQGGSFSRIAIDTTPANPNLVYALYGNSNNGFYGFYRSLDGGDSWALMSDSPNLLGWSTSGSDSGGQAWYDLALDSSPTDENVVYVGGVNVWRSNNGGISWDCIGYWSYGGPPYVHADHHRKEWFVDSDGNPVLYNANDGGVYRYSENTNSWEEISHGMVIQQIYRFGVFQNSPDVEKIIFGNQDNGTKLMDGDDFSAVLGGDGFEGAIDPVDSDYMYGELYYGQMYRSTDGGNSWYDANNGVQEDGAWLTPFVIDPALPNVLWKGTNYMYRSTNRASSWSRFNDSNAGGSYYDNFTAIAVAPGNSNVVYGVNPNSDLVYTTDGGATWQLNNVPGGRPSSPTTYIAVHPFNDSIIYATAGGYIENQKVFVSYDRGNTWDNLSDGLPNLPVNCVAVHPLDPNHVYIGTDVGVMFSDDAGDTWQDWSTGLPNVIVSELELHATSNTMVAATYGRGIWQSPAEEVDADPFLTLTGPNGGEEWTIHTEQTIRWTSYGVNGDVRIEINRDYPNGSWDVLIASTPNDWAESWVVTGPQSNNVRFRVTSIDQPALSDESDGNITFVEPSLTIVQPNGGETLPTGQIYTVQWTSVAIPGNLGVDLNLDYPDGDWLTLVEGVPDVGSLSFTPNQSMVTDNARFRIRSLSLDNVSDVSDGDFSIAFVPSLTLESVSDDTEWTFGAEVTVEWSDNISDDIRIELVDDNEIATELATVSSPGTGNDSAEIIVEDGTPGMAYTLRISSADDPSLLDESDGMVTVELAAPTLASPAAGETITGDPAIFSWHPVAGAESYTWSLATSDDFENDLVSEIGGLADTSYVTSFDQNDELFWRVMAESGVDYTGPASATQSFTVDATSVAELEFSGVPETFALSAVYPNPFNPETRIVVALPQTSELSVKVYNTEGRLVETLSDGRHPAGYQTFVFGSDRLASGAYFVSVRVPGELDITRKVTLIR